MKNSNLFKVFAAALLTVLIFSLLSCAAKKSEPWGNEKTGFILKYRSETGKTQKYSFNMDTELLMDIMGNETEMIFTFKSEIFLKTKNVNEDGSLIFGMGFNSAEISVSGPQGDMSPDLSGIIGKELDLTISDKGKFIEMKNEDQFPMIEGYNQRITDNFRNFFYEMSEVPVKINDRWTSTDSYTSEEGDNKTTTNVNTKYTIIEKIMKDNLDCLKIGFEQAVEIEGEGSQMGMDFTMKGTGKNTGELFFAYKEGFFIDVASTGTIDMAMSMQGMDIPMNGTVKTTAQLIE